MAVTTVNISIDPDLLALVDKRAASENRSRSGLIGEFLRFAFNRFDPAWRDGKDEESDA